METVQKEKFNEQSTKFALNLFHQIVVQKGIKDGAPSNTFMSPTSIAVALAMAYNGADGTMKAEINKEIFYGMDDNVIESNTKNLCKLLNKGNDKAGYTLNMANGAFCHEGYAILESFMKILKDDYMEEAKVVNFGEQQATDDINNWVSEKTNQKIQKLFEFLGFDTRLVLANAIYFKGDWHTKFDQSHTEQKPFHVTAHVKKQLLTMQARNNSFHLNENDKEWSVLGMPYKGQELLMAIFLPKGQHEFDLISLEKQMSGMKLWKLIDGLKLHDKLELEVQLPKFNIECDANLVECLEKMGIHEMFQMGSANFSKITGNRYLHVSQIVHKAVIDVNEEGSVAAAATGVSFTSRSMPRFDRFTANHPFMFAIVDKQKRCLLFLGHFYG